MRTRAELGDGIVFLGSLELGLIAIDFDGFVLLKLRGHGRNGDGVSVRAEPVKFRFDEAGALSCARAFGGPANYFVNFEDVGAIDGFAGNAESFRLLRERIAGHGVGVFQSYMRVGLVSVIFEDEDDGEFPDGGEIQRFVECALLR